MTWRALIVDDEAPARAHLRRLLVAHPEIEIAGEAGTIGEAADLCRKRPIDLLFLDIQMPQASGFDLLTKLNPVPRIIFVTAHEEFALRAFEVSAVDYLMKPVFPDRLDRALKRIASGSGIDVCPDEKFHTDDTLFLQNDRTLRMVPIRQIVCITAERNYSTVLLTDGKEFLIYRNLNQWEQRLPKGMFIRLDRSIILNQQHLLEIKIVDRDTGKMFITGRQEPIVLGRTALARMRAHLAET